jgi:hypothetical protein
MGEEPTTRQNARRGYPQGIIGEERRRHPRSNFKNAERSRNVVETKGSGRVKIRSEAGILLKKKVLLAESRNVIGKQGY